MKSRFQCKLGKVTVDALSETCAIRYRKLVRRVPRIRTDTCSPTILVSKSGKLENKLRLNELCMYISSNMALMCGEIPERKTGLMSALKT